MKPEETATAEEGNRTVIQALQAGIHDLVTLVPPTHRLRRAGRAIGEFSHARALLRTTYGDW